jgi:GMP synthase-like glutamine amidotransferase
MNIHFFQHVLFEGLGSIEAWARSGNHQLTGTHFFQNDLLPEVENFDWLIVMGGPMGVADEQKYPWMNSEKRSIEKAIHDGKTVLGVCLGAQLIADVLGARVYSNQHKEIGWFPIELTDEGQRSSLLGFIPDRFDVFHWHGDTFDLPDGAIHLTRSEACQQQAFVYAERVVGLQFHLELTPQNVRELIRNCAEELVESRYIQSPSQMLTRTSDFHQTNQVMNEILARLQELG